MIKVYMVDGVLWNWDTDKGKWSKVWEDKERKTWAEWEERHREKPLPLLTKEEAKAITDLYVQNIKMKDTEPNLKLLHKANMVLLEKLGFAEWLEKLDYSSPAIKQEIMEKAITMQTFEDHVAWVNLVLERMGL